MEIFPRYWPFVRGIHRSPVNSPHKGQWRGAWTNGWVNNRDAGDLRRHRAHYDDTVMRYCVVMIYGNSCRYCTPVNEINTPRLRAFIMMLTRIPHLLLRDIVWFIGPTQNVIAVPVVPWTTIRIQVYNTEASIRSLYWGNPVYIV